MVKKLVSIALLVSLAFLVLSSNIILAETITYLYSDPGDIPLYKALSNKTSVEASDMPSGQIILALDLNYAFMNKSSQKIFLLLLNEAYKGRIVIIGFNTLRGMVKTCPETLRIIGVSANFTSLGVLEIAPRNGFEFQPFKYDSNIYGVALVKTQNGRVLLRASGIPILIETPLGRGKLVILTINPSNYYLETRDPRVADFIISIINYYTTKKLPITTIVATSIVLGAVVAYISFSNNPQIEKLRRLIKWIPLIIAKYVIPHRRELENKLRKSIYNYIKEKGYATVMDIKSTFSISRTNARWHLYVLARAGLLDSVKIQNTEIYFPPGRENRLEAIKRFLLENKVRREIYKMLSEGRNVSEMARVLGVSKSTVIHHIRVLRKYGVISDAR